MKRIVQLKVIAIFLLLLVTAGCTTPNVKPFAESTATIVTGFKVGSTKTLASLNLSGESDKAAYLEGELKVRYELLDALLVFSIELAQIQSDSDRSKESVHQISTAVSHLGLALSSGLSVPAAALGERLADEALEIREFHLISKSLKEIDPHIEEIANLLEQDIQSFRNIYKEKMTEAYVEKLKEAQKIPDKALKQRIKKLQDEASKVSPDPIAVSVLTAIYPVYQDRQQENKFLLEEVETIRKDLKKGDLFYGSMKTAIVAWSKAYKDLASAFEENRQINFTELYIKAQEINTLIDAL